MKISIQQPEHLPWLGYFDKVRQVDKVVLLDNVQFKKRYFENRNKIRTKNGWQWISVPVLSKGKYKQKINQVKIDNSQKWRKKYLKTIYHSYSKARYFNQYFSGFQKIINKRWKNLASLNIAIIKYCCLSLNLKKKFILASKLNVKGKKDNLLLNICKELKADTYLSGSFGKSYIKKEIFKKAGIKLEFQNFIYPEYKQIYKPFVPGMSAIDLVFNSGPKSSNILCPK